jgi:hypothetical protein
MKICVRRSLSFDGCQFMFVEVLKTDKEWIDFVENVSGGTFYHTIKWRNVIQKTFQYEPLYLVVKDNNNCVLGVCPGFITGSRGIKIFDSIPFSDYGGPLITDSYVHQGSKLLSKFFLDFFPSKGIKYAKVCLMQESNVSKFIQVPVVYSERAKGVMEINLKLTSSDFLWDKVFSRNLKKKIKHVETDGYTAHEAKTKSDLMDFYNLYTRNMRDHIGASPDPYSFIENMWELLHPDSLRIWLLRKERTVAADFFLMTKEGSYAHYAAVDRDQLSARVSPIDYLRWLEINKAEEEGKQIVSLGSTPVDPRGRYFIQKRRIGGSFRSQEEVWFPLTNLGYTLLRTMDTVVPIWKSVRTFLPVSLGSFLNRKFLSL